MASTEMGGFVEETSLTASSLLSTFVELLAAFVLLLAATMSYLASIIVKYFGVHPPCFSQGRSLIEQRFLNFFCDREFENFQNLAGLLLPRRNCDSNVSGMCSPYCSGTDKSSTHFPFFKCHPQGSRLSTKRAYLKCQGLDSTHIENKSDMALKEWKRCMYCSSLFQGTSEEATIERMLANVTAEELRGCPRESFDGEDIGQDAAVRLFDMERAPTLDFERQKGSFFCKYAFYEQVNGSSLEFCDAAADCLLEDRFHADDDVEELAWHLSHTPKDAALKLDSDVGILLLDNVMPEDGQQHYDPLGSDRIQLPKDDDSLGFEKKEFEMRSADVKSETGHIDLDIQNETDLLRQTLNAEREFLNALYFELEEERNASAIATNETMAMIARLQKEKAALQMEARQFQRIAEEKAMHDQEAIAVLKDILMKREAEKLALEKEVELYKCRLFGDKINQWERMKKEGDDDRKAAALQDNEVSMLFSEEKNKLQSSRIGDDKIELFSSTTCIPSSQKGLSGGNFTKGTSNSSLQFWDAGNLLESLRMVDADNALNFKHPEKLHEGNMKTLSSLATSDSPVVEVDQDSIHDELGQKHILDPKNMMGGQRNQAMPFNEWDGYSNGHEVQLIAEHDEKKLVGKLRSNYEEKWLTVLERLENLESHIQHLKQTKS